MTDKYMKQVAVYYLNDLEGCTIEESIETLQNILLKYGNLTFTEPEDYDDISTLYQEIPMTQEEIEKEKILVALYSKLDDTRYKILTLEDKLENLKKSVHRDKPTEAILQKTNILFTFKNEPTIGEIDIAANEFPDKLDKTYRVVDGKHVLTSGFSFDAEYEHKLAKWHTIVGKRQLEIIPQESELENKISELKELLSQQESEYYYAARK